MQQVVDTEQYGHSMKMNGIGLVDVVDRLVIALRTSLGILLRELIDRFLAGKSAEWAVSYAALQAASQGVRRKRIAEWSENPDAFS